VKVAKPERSVGLDLGDRFSHYCVLNQEGEVTEEGRMQSSESVLRKHFAKEAVCYGSRYSLTVGEPVIEATWSSGTGG
jgi:hypothetical protein